MTTSPLTTTKVDDLYASDYVAWVEATVQQLKQRDYDSADWENLLDEIGDMARSEKRRLKSNLIVVILHLLKWQYQPARRSGSGAGSIVEHRRRVQEALEASPSLKPYLESIFSDAYTSARRQAVAETKLPETAFPADCPYTVSQTVNNEFMPNS